jgi:glycosyltransferase involved in cell wall biosynthesis
VICLPYREIENSGVLAEAIRHGVVPVTTAVGGLPETLARYDMPEPVPIDDAAALAVRLAEALTDEGVRARATAGMRRARRELTWARAAETHEELYRDVLAGRSRGSA